MSALWTAADAAAATDGRRQGGDWAATGVSIDTRTLAPGDLFVALSAARDGHDFVADALAKGAAAALVARVPEGVADDAPLLVVPDVQAGLEALGQAGRARAAARVVAVTGSVGKTSVKEMLRRALGVAGPVHAAEASYNNHWGVPLTLARLPSDAAFAVIEIGMNHPGEIEPLARMARPHVALVTAIAPAHLEAFGDVAGIVEEKAAIFGGLEPGGTAVLNADTEGASRLRAVAGDHADRVLSFGTEAGAEVRATSLESGAAFARLAAAGDGFGKVALTLAAPGRHVAMNALGALATAWAAGADPADAARALADWAPPGGRGARRLIAVPGGAITLIDDSYNANPTSMAAALDVLAAAPGRLIAILGDMLELGPDADALHAALADHPAMTHIHRIHCVGPRMAALHAALPEDRQGKQVDDAATLAARAATLVEPGDVVLVKGSKASQVSTVAQALVAAAEEATRCSTG